MRVLPRDPTLYLLGPADIKQDLLPSHIKPYQGSLEKVVSWARAYLCQPHALLGREGPVCPYTQPSLDRGLFWLAVYPGPHPTLEEVYAFVLKYQEWFLELDPLTGKEAQYKALLILFPDLERDAAPDVIDTVQANLKPEFITKGLMIGQFHAACEEPALWNPHFRPLRSPVPLLAIRYMVPTDFPFLKDEGSWVSTYLQHFGHAVPTRLQAAVGEAALRFDLEYHSR